MKKMFKWVSIILFVSILCLISVILLRQNQVFDVPYPEIQASTDSAIIAKGKYLVYGPAHCADCHSSPSTLAELEKGAEVPLVGGRVFKIPIGEIHARNITSDKETGIGKLTDKEIARALRYGVSEKGKAFLDIMPFHDMCNADLTAIISYLRTLPPVSNLLPQTSYNALGMAINAFVIKPIGPSGPVLNDIKRDTSIEFGKYLAFSVANCRGCHTNRDLKTGDFVGPDFAGGFKMDIQDEPGSFLVSPNLTPHETGILTGWSLAKFTSRFRNGKLIEKSHMPWAPFGKMSDDDLKAIYKFLKTVEPIENKTPVGVQHNS